MSNSTTTANGADNQNGFGAKLVAARKKRGMSVEQVADELNILKRHVEAIEAQDFTALPQFAFARGFVMNYAKLVDLPVQEIVQQFEDSYPKNLKADSPDTIKPPVQPMGTLNRGRAPIRINFGLIVGLMALILLALAILKLVSGTTATPTQSETTPAVADGLTANEQAQGASLDSAGSTIASATTSTPTTNAGSVLGASDTPAAAQGAEGTVDLWIKEKVVISVKDATGAVLLSGEQGRGGHNLKGVSPFSIEVNNPSRINIDFNKNPVNMKTYGSEQTTITLQ